MKNLKSIIALFAAVLIITACSKDEDFFNEMDSVSNEQSYLSSQGSEDILTKGVDRVADSAVDWDPNGTVSDGTELKSQGSEDILTKGVDRVADSAVDWDPNGTATDGDRILGSSTTTSTSAEISAAPVPFWVELLLQINVSCYGESSGHAVVEAHGGIGDVTYEWSNGQTGSRLTNVRAGYYEVTATDEQGRMATKEVFIVQPARPLFVNVLETGHETCIRSGGASVVGSGGTPPYTYEWSTGGTMSTWSTRPLPVGSHTVTVMDANGCRVSQLIVIEDFSDGPEVEFEPVEDLMCGRESVFIDVASDWNSDWEYTWSTTDGHIARYPLLPPGVIVDEPGTYTLTVRDPATGCVTTRSVTVRRIIKTISAGFAGKDQNIIYGSSVVLNAKPSIPVARYTWTPKMKINGDNRSKKVQTKKLYRTTTFTLQIEDKDGCTFEDDVTVKVIAKPAVDLERSHEISTVK